MSAPCRETPSWASATPRPVPPFSETQPYGVLARYAIGLPDQVRAASVDALNQVLVDTMSLRDLYKKHHWQTSGPTFYSLHLLFDKHFAEQAELVDTIAERIQALGGVALAMAPDVAEMTKIERPARGREAVPTQLSRLLEAYDVILTEARVMAKAATQGGDDGTNDLLVSDVTRVTTARRPISKAAEEGDSPEGATMNDINELETSPHTMIASGKVLEAGAARFHAVAARRAGATWEDKLIAR